MHVPPSEDLPSPVLGAKQIRDVASRVFRPLAERLALGTEWSMVDTAHQLHVDGVLRRRFSFEAERDDDMEWTEYIVSVSDIRPFDQDWRTSVVKTLLQHSADEVEDDLVLAMFGFGPEDDEAEAEDELEGYYSHDIDYVFRVPYGRYPAEAERHVAFAFLDEHGDPVDSEPAIHSSLASRVGYNANDISQLFLHGEPVFLQPDHEAELLRPTRHDLEIIVNKLKRVGLVRSTCKVLSAQYDV